MLLRALPAGVVLLVLPDGAAAAVIYEPFDYPDGALPGRVNPTNGLPWAAMGTDQEDDILVGGSSLHVAGLAPSAGKSVTYEGLGRTARLALGQNATAGSAYYSLAVSVNGYGNLLDFPFGVFIAGFNSATGGSTSPPSQAGARLLIRAGTVADTFHVGVVKNSSTAADFAFDLTNHRFDETIFVVGRYSMAAGADNDASALWINPDPASFGAATPPPPTLTSTAGGDLSNGVRSFLLRQSHEGVPAVTVDELRVDTTWAGVTPPVPESGTSCMLPALALLLSRRRRRHARPAGRSSGQC